MGLGLRCLISWSAWVSAANIISESLQLYFLVSWYLQLYGSGSQLLYVLSSAALLLGLCSYMGLVSAAIFSVLAAI